MAVYAIVLYILAVTFIFQVVHTWKEIMQKKKKGQRTWKEVVQKDCQARNLNKEDAMDRGRWKKLIKIG